MGSPIISASGMDGVLTCVRIEAEDVNFLMEFLVDYAFKWEDIGTALNFLPGKLSNISCAHQASGPKKCLKEILNEYAHLPITEQPTLKRLCCALRSNLVDLGRMANELEEKVNSLPSQQYKGSGMKPRDVKLSVTNKSMECEQPHPSSDLQDPDDGLIRVPKTTTFLTDLGLVMPAIRGKKTLLVAGGILVLLFAIFVMMIYNPRIDYSNQPFQASTADCKRISSYKELEKVLREIDNPMEKICRDLNIARHTCNTHYHNRNLRPDVVALEYEQQNPTMCWEKIIMHLCVDFDHVKLAFELAQRHNILNAYSLHCTV